MFQSNSLESLAAKVPRKSSFFSQLVQMDYTIEESETKDKYRTTGINKEMAKSLAKVKLRKTETKLLSHAII